MWKLVLKRMVSDVWEWVILPTLALSALVGSVVCLLAVPGRLLDVFAAPTPVLVIGTLMWAAIVGIGLCIWIDHARDAVRKERK